MITTLTKGQATVGKIFGDIAADAGSIESTNIIAGAILTTNIGAGAVASSKEVRAWATLGNGAGATTTAPLPAANGGYLLTNTGATGGFVVTGATTTVLDEPTAGDFYRFVVDANPSATVDIDIKSLVAVFNADSDMVIRFNAPGQFANIEALNSERWVVTDHSPGVTFEATT